MPVVTKRKLLLGEVQPGMVLAEPVFLAGERMVFLSEQTVLTERLLASLHRAGKEELVVRDCGQAVPAASSSQEVFRQTYQHLLGEMEDVFRRLRYGGALEERQINDLAEETLVILHQPDVLALLSDAGQGSASFLHHSLNVGLLCGLLASWQDGGAVAVKEAVMAGLLHDLGKSLVPERISEKGDSLLPHEMSVVRCHPFYSFQLLVGAGVPDCVCRAALHHHERLDGSGYPEGLQGEHISLLAQLVAVADVYDAMISPRPHRPALSPLEALGELLQGMFGKFNPSLCLLLAERLKDVLVGATVVFADGREGKILQFAQALSPWPLVELADGEYLELQPRTVPVAVKGLQGCWVEGRAPE